MLWQIKSRLRGYKVFVQQPPNGFHLQTIALKIFLINKKRKKMVNCSRAQVNVHLFA